MLNEDLTDFFPTDGFNVTASYTPNGSAAVPVEVIFDNSYLGPDSGELEIGTRQPFITALESDFANAAEGDEITINSTDYTLTSQIEPDGQGLVEIYLNKV